MSKRLITPLSTNNSMIIKFFHEHQNLDFEDTVLSFVEIMEKLSDTMNNSINSSLVSDILSHLKNMNLIVLFVVGYSGNCQLVELTLKGITNGLSDNVVVYRLDAKKNPEAVSDYGIREYPTILFFKNGLIVDHHTGLISKRELYTKVLRFIKLNSENK